MTSVAELSKPERLRLAIEEFYGRSQRQRHPQGEWLDGLWFPSELERRSCCEEIQPTVRNRQALEGHCRTQAHVAALFEIRIGELKAAVRADRKAGSPIADRVISSFLAPPLLGFGAFDAFRRQARRKAFERLEDAVALCMPLMEQLRALKGEDGEEADIPLLENASARVEFLLTAIKHSESQLSNLACTGALLETLSAQLEESKRKGRRVRRREPKGEAS